MDLIYTVNEKFFFKFISLEIGFLQSLRLSIFPYILNNANHVIMITSEILNRFEKNSDNVLIMPVSRMRSLITYVALMVHLQGHINAFDCIH